MDASLTPRSNHGTMVEQEEEEEDVASMSTSSENSSASSDFTDDAASSTSSSSSSSSTSPPGKAEQFEDGPLHRMSSLMAQLPFKRGLSKFYNGKSQSFTSLSNVRSLEDLAKPQRPCRKKFKASRSYGGGMDSQKSLSPKGCSKTIAKKASRGSPFSLGARSRRPIPPQKSSNFSSHGHTLLFA